MYGRNQHNIGEQLFSNLKFKLKTRMIFKDGGVVTSHATWLHVDGKDSSGEGKSEGAEERRQLLGQYPGVD